ncbi:MAG TPA: hypothetical protein VF808_19910 [Ktedonobacterales bacterium]
MAADFSNAPTQPDPVPPGPVIPPMGAGAPWGAGQPGQTISYSPPQPLPGPYIPPTVTDQQPLAPIPYGWAGIADVTQTIVDPPVLAPRPPMAPAPRAPRYTRPVSAPAPRAAARSVPVERVWRLLPFPHIMLGLGMVLLLAALNIPWGMTSDGTLVYAQSFSIPYLSDQPELAGQVAQNIVWSAGLLSLVLAGLNYFLTLINLALRPIRAGGCATVLLFPVMLLAMALLAGVDIGALIFGAFDPLAGVVLMPWQSGFTLVGAHAELGYYAWYAGIVLNAVGMATQPFVRR